jgi:hypothetical protein
MDCAIAFLCRGGCANRLSIHRPLTQGPLQLSRTPGQKRLGMATIWELYFGIRSRWAAPLLLPSFQSALGSGQDLPSDGDRLLVFARLVKVKNPAIE